MEGLAMSKKFFVLALGALMTISCIACGQNTATTSTLEHHDTAITEEQFRISDSKDSQTISIAEPITPTGTLVNNGKFNVDKFSWESEALEFMMTEKQILFLYDNIWFIEISGDAQSTTQAAISVGKWETGRSDRWNITYYSCVFDFGTKVKVSSRDYPEYTYYISQNTLDYLQATVDAMKANPQFDTPPNVPGITFKPCQFNDPFIQFEQ